MGRCVLEEITVECDWMEGFEGIVRRPIVGFHEVYTSL
jgi:hypothetical protein